MAKIKICGLTSLNDISYINETGVDFAGFIFFHKSKRYITLNQAIEMKNLLNSSIKSVGVFVNENIKEIINIANYGVIDIIQLHGNETNENIKEIKEKIGLPIIKALKADENLEFNIQNTIADYVLIDSFSTNKFGGTGITFDYGLIPNTDKKFFLAGGLNIDNIDNAIKMKPYCLDINSGVEIEGKKDRSKIIEIVKKIKNK